jgi:hypothetical protein
MTEWSDLLWVPVSGVLTVLTTVHHSMILMPLKKLYFHGPLFHGYGFWGGTPHEDMCASLSPGTAASFWLKNSDECSRIVDQHFEAFVVCIQLLLYTVTLYKLGSWCFMRYFVIQPTLTHIEQLLSMRPCFQCSAAPESRSRRPPKRVSHHFKEKSQGAREDKRRQ